MPNNTGNRLVRATWGLVVATFLLFGVGVFQYLVSRSTDTALRESASALREAAKFQAASANTIERQMELQLRSRVAIVPVSVSLDLNNPLGIALGIADTGVSDIDKSWTTFKAGIVAQRNDNNYDNDQLPWSMTQKTPLMVESRFPFASISDATTGSNVTQTDIDNLKNGQLVVIRGTITTEDQLQKGRTRHFCWLIDWGAIEFARHLPPGPMNVGACEGNYETDTP
jgi:hypothetical protein